MAGDSLVSEPEVTLVLEGAEQAAGITQHKVLIVGAIVDGEARTYVDGELAENVPVDSKSIEALFGATAMVTRMVKNFRKINKVTQVDVIATVEAAPE